MDCGKHTGLRNLVLSKPGTCWVILGKFLWVFFRISILELILIGFLLLTFHTFGPKNQLQNLYQLVYVLLCGQYA